MFCVEFVIHCYDIMTLIEITFFLVLLRNTKISVGSFLAE